MSSENQPSSAIYTPSPHGEGVREVRLSSLSTGYGRHVVASNLTATLEAGQLTSLLGSNGVGKSTLLRTMTALLSPLRGEVTIGERPLSDFTAQQLAQTISVVLTERPSLQGMRVRDVVALGRAPYTGFFGGLGENDNVIVDEAIAKVGIGSLASRMAHTLSDGERQKVMIAKALAQDTPVIMLDEPTAFLDFSAKVEAMLLLRELAHKMQKAILLSTHDVELALQCSDCLWLMNREGITVGTPQQLALDGTLSDFFKSDGITFDADTMRFNIQ